MDMKRIRIHLIKEESDLPTVVESSVKKNRAYYICALASQWMCRDSAYAQQICSLCAATCDACATECSKFQDSHCKQYAECVK
jgi:hypothetical protein